MKKQITGLLLALAALVSLPAAAQFAPGQVLTAAQLNSAFAGVLPIAGGTLTGPLTVPTLTATTALNTAHANITGGTISALSSPLPQAAGGTGTTSATGTGSVVLSSAPSISNPTITGSLTATGLVTLADHATQAANTIVANATGSSASPTAVAVPSCSSSSSALNWTSGTGIGCNSAINAATLGGATFAAPGAIGATTPGTAAFTTLTASGAATLNTLASSGATITGGTINNTPIGAITPVAGTFTFLGIPSLASGANLFTLGLDPAQGGSILWNSALTRIGGNLTLDANLGNNSNDEFLTVIEANQQATTLVTLTTTASTSTSNNVLTFASVPASVKIGMAISDSTNVNAIQQLFVTAKTSTTITMSGNPLSTVDSGDTIVIGFQNFKGPLYLGANCYDASTYQFTRACNGLTAYTTIQNGVTNGYAEGTVIMAGATGTGDGLMISGEFDIEPQANPNSNHCDQSGVSNCHTNFWVANFGTVRGSWMLDSASGGPGWNNGLALRNIAAGGLAVQIPNNTVIASTNAAGSTIFDLIYAGSDDNVHIGTGATSVAVDVPLNVGTGGIVGTQNGSDAATGRVGEYPTPTNLTGVSLTSGAAANVSSMSLTAGDWDIECTTVFSPNSSTSINSYGTGVTQTSGTYEGGGTYQAIATASFTTSGTFAITTPLVRKKFTSTTTEYCVASSTFTTSTMTASGYMRARRPR